MPSVDTVKIGTNEYPVSPSKDDTLTNYTGSDTASASTETNCSISNLSKITDLSSLKDSINQILTLLNKVSNDFDSRISVLEAAIDIPYPPNHRYESKNIGTWNTQQDVDTFFANHNHDNEYSGLALGNYVTINDGVYNTQWEIAGFDMEHNRLAVDNTTYDNGYGICLIPKIDLGVKMTWNDTNTLTGGYMSSTMHSSHLVTVANNLKNILGNHLVLRNVLLSSIVNSANKSNSYTWTTSYCTLMGVGQLTGKFGQHWNICDDGEANYKLPLFDYEGYKTGYRYWLRGVYGGGSYYYAWYVTSNGGTTSYYACNTSDVRPLIYLR